MSAKYHLDRQDLEKLFDNAITFGAMGSLLALTSLQAGKSISEIQSILYYWALSVAIDFLKKFTASS